MNAVFHLIRHASHDQLGKRLTGRTPGCSLSPSGREEALRLGERFARVPLDAVRASPQERARETAERLVAVRAETVGIADELDEIDFGRWAGQSFEALEADPDWRTWNADRGRASTPGGETMQDVAVRVVRLLDELRVRVPAGTFALVSHCDTIKAAVCHYLALPFERMDRFEISPASVTTIAVGNWGGKVLALNAVETSAGALR